LSLWSILPEATDHRFRIRSKIFDIELVDLLAIYLKLSATHQSHYERCYISELIEAITDYFFQFELVLSRREFSKLHRLLDQKITYQAKMSSVDIDFHLRAAVSQTAWPDPEGN